MVKKALRGMLRISNWIPLIPIIVFFAMAHYLPQNRLAIVVNALDIGAWVLILRAYGPALWEKWRSDEKVTSEIYVLSGILLYVTALAMSRIWSLAIIFSGKPAWMINHWFQSFCYLLMALSCYYFLRVPGSSVSRKYIAWALAISLTIMGAALLMS